MSTRGAMYIRDQLLERCQRERNELIAISAVTVSHLPRLGAWVRLARTLSRILRILTMRAAATPGRN